MNPDERVDVDALMDQVRARVDERRRAGEYGDLDDTPSFAELAMHDELAASANRMAAAARTTGLVPKLAPRAPGTQAGPSPDDAAAPPPTLRDTTPSDSPPPLPEGISGRVYGMARRIADVTFGSRVTNFLDRLQQYISISADNSRVAAERIIALESRVDSLEREVVKLRKVIRSASKTGGGRSPRKPA